MLRKCFFLSLHFLMLNSVGQSKAVNSQFKWKPLYLGHKYHLRSWQPCSVGWPWKTVQYCLLRKNKNSHLYRDENCSDQTLNSPDAHHSTLLLTYLVNLEKNLIEVIRCFSLSPVSGIDLRNKHQRERDEEAAFQDEKQVKVRQVA